MNAKARQLTTLNADTQFGESDSVPVYRADNLEWRERLYKYGLKPQQKPLGRIPGRSLQLSDIGLSRGGEATARGRACQRTARVCTFRCKHIRVGAVQAVHWCA